ncbi:MAG TPA: hypothetical protein VG755_23270, partial [Nannocystaceae bacterium]|nr:hypothetical protein [Nannocystaceae bacterium]
MMLLLAACDEPPATIDVSDPSPTVVDPGAPEIYGCLALRDGACWMPEGPGKLGVWLDLAPDADVRTSIDAVDVEHTSRSADRGLRIAIGVPEDARAVTLTGVDPPWPSPLTISLQRVPRLPVLAEARQLHAGGDVAGARRLLERHTVEDPLTAIRIQDQLRALAWANGDTEEAITRATAVVELARANDYPAHLADASFNVFYLHYISGELVRAREWAERTANEGAGASRFALIRAYEEGLLAAGTGDPDRAERSFATVTRLAERAGHLQHLLAALQMRAVMLAELGRADDARAVAAEAMRYAFDETTSCNDRLRILDNIAWASIRLAQGGLDWDPPFEML